MKMYILVECIRSMKSFMGTCAVKAKMWEYIPVIQSTKSSLEKRNYDSLLLLPHGGFLTGNVTDRWSAVADTPALCHQLDEKRLWFR